MWSERQAVEVFHLVFLRTFGSRVDKALFAVKGGCNLRFFLRSVRYSEDMDLDVRTMSMGTLANNVDRVLESDSFLHTLRSQQIEIEQVSKPKQTRTTQRWKVALRVGVAQTSVPTKIEYSRRDFDAEPALEPVNAEVVRHYRLYSVLFPHYTAQVALGQKIAALALRSQTQARDVFDLKVLLDSGAGRDPLTASAVAQLPSAIENAMTLGYDEFAGQVLAYLEPAHQADYRSRAVWEGLQAEVINALEALRA